MVICGNVESILVGARFIRLSEHILISLRDLLVSVALSLSKELRHLFAGSRQLKVDHNRRPLTLILCDGASCGTNDNLGVHEISKTKSTRHAAGQAT